MHSQIDELPLVTGNSTSEDESVGDVRSLFWLKKRLLGGFVAVLLVSAIGLVSLRGSSTKVLADPVHDTVGLFKDTSKPKNKKPNHGTYVAVCGVDFKLDNVLWSNLGNLGPDVGEEGIVYNASMMDGGVFVRKIIAKINAKTKYHEQPASASTNGMYHEFGVIKVLTGTHVRLMISFWNPDNTPLTLDEFQMTWYDLDAGFRGKVAREYIVVGGPKLSLSTHGTSVRSVDLQEAKEKHGGRRRRSTAITRSGGKHGKVVYYAKYQGTFADNPKFSKDLTGQQKKRVAVTKFSNVHSFQVGIGSTKGHGSRSFMFAFMNPLACKWIEGCTCNGPSFNHGKEGVDNLVCDDTPKEVHARFNARCKAGYSQVQDAMDLKVLCTGETDYPQWDATQLQTAVESLDCEKKTCSRDSLLEFIKNVGDVKVVDTKWGEEADVEFSCKEGYAQSVSGPFKLGCEFHEGKVQWDRFSVEEVQCVKKTCSCDAIQEGHEDIGLDCEDTAWGERSEIKVSCPKGHEAHGGKTDFEIECDLKGPEPEWRSKGKYGISRTECSKKQCLAADVTKIVNNTKHVSASDAPFGKEVSVDVVCETNHELTKNGVPVKDDKATLVCELEGESAVWKEQDFACTRTTCKCDDIDIESESGITCDDTAWGEKGKIGVKCKEGFEVDGAIEVACKLDGDTPKWEAVDPETVRKTTCQKQQCKCGDLNIAHSSNHGCKAAATWGDEKALDVKCQTGYELPGGVDFVKATCALKDGHVRWTAAKNDLKCVKKTCGCEALKNQISGASDAKCDLEPPFGQSANVKVQCPNGLSLTAHGSKQNSDLVVACVLSKEGNSEWDFSRLGRLSCSRTHSVDERDPKPHDDATEVGRVVAGVVGVGSAVGGAAAAASI